MLKKSLLSFLVVAFFSVIAGCNTIEGAGEDLEKGGEKIQDASKDARN